MKSHVTTLESNKVKVSVEVDETEIEAAIDDAFRKIAKEIRLPGFRPGKAPRKVLEARIGKDYARGEAIRESLPEYYRRAIVEHDVDVIAAPEIDITAGEESGPVEFEAVVEVRPTITVAGYDGLRVELPALEPTDDEVAKQIDSLRGQFSERVEVERAAAEGDYVTMDIAGSHDGEAVESLTAEGYTYEVGAGFVVEGIDEALIGASAGDEVEFSAEHPDPDTEGELTFAITVVRVEERRLPDLTDEFVAEATEFSSVAELEADTRERIRRVRRSQGRAMLADRTSAALAELVTDDIPDALVDDAVQNQLQDMAMRLASQGIRIEQFLQATGQRIEDLVENLREPAAQAARVDLALRAVAAAEGLEATDDDLDAEIAESAEQMGRDPEVVREALASNGQLSAVRADLGKRRAMEWLIESVTIVDPDGHPIAREDLEEPAAEGDDAEADGDDIVDAEVDADDTDENAGDATGNTDADAAVGDEDEPGSDPDTDAAHDADEGDEQ